MEAVPHDVVQMVACLLIRSCGSGKDRNNRPTGLKKIMKQTYCIPGPLAVLVNEFSASASEIFAAAIQDYGRVIIGSTSTYGKGTA